VSAHFQKIELNVKSLQNICLLRCYGLEYDALTQLNLELVFCPWGLVMGLPILKITQLLRRWPRHVPDGQAMCLTTSDIGY
jgi:hypothetical protein